MPGFDGTGPRGEGPMTGGGRGYCVVDLNAAGVRPGAGRGFFGRGGGRGNRNRFYATGLPGWMRAQRGMPFGFAQGRQEELHILKTQADLLKQQLENAQSRIQELEGKKGENSI